MAFYICHWPRCTRSVSVASVIFICRCLHTLPLCVWITMLVEGNKAAMISPAGVCVWVQPPVTVTWMLKVWSRRTLEPTVFIGGRGRKGTWHKRHSGENAPCVHYITRSLPSSAAVSKLKITQTCASFLLRSAHVISVTAIDTPWPWWWITQPNIMARTSHDLSPQRDNPHLFP